MMDGDGDDHGDGDGVDDGDDDDDDDDDDGDDDEVSYGFRMTQDMLPEIILLMIMLKRACQAASGGLGFCRIPCNGLTNRHWASGHIMTMK